MPVVTPKTAGRRETITWTSELKKRRSNSKSKKERKKKKKKKEKKERQNLESIRALCD